MTKNGDVLQPRRAKESARFLTNFAVTTKKPQWKFALKSTPCLELAILLLDFPDQHHTTKTAYRVL
jgi:hypothetical protein